MSNREIAYQLLDRVPERKIKFAIVYLQELTAGESEDEPNTETIAAMDELIRGDGETYQSLDDMWADLEEPEC